MRTPHSDQTLGRRPIAVTPGEPAGIGPQITLKLATHTVEYPIVVIADPDWLRQCASALNIDVTIKSVTDVGSVPVKPAAHTVYVLPVSLQAPAVTGRLDHRNAPYVLSCLDVAAQGCLSGQFAAMVTGPVHKGVINDAGIAFTGHTEYLAAKAGQSKTVMMLATNDLRVALVTTHLPLSQVSNAVTTAAIEYTCVTTANSLRERFGISEPRLMVLGLNPHAGESGHMGREEIDVIEPCLEQLRTRGFHIVGPVPADTAFTPDWLIKSDVVIAMYHDQGLPVLKSQGFGDAVNITLGLPFIRTSVDHGTALDIATENSADESSLVTALRLATGLVESSS